MASEELLAGLSGAAVLIVDRQGDKVLGGNAQAASLLGVAPEALAGHVWTRLLGVQAAAAMPLARAVREGVRAALPPTLLRPPGRDELVVGGYLFAQDDAGRETSVLLLFQLGPGVGPLFTRAPEPADVVAVLGLDSPDGTIRWDVGEVSRRMVDIRFGLQQIVPDRHDVGIPVGTTIPVILRDVTVEQGQDICGALLSHLTPLLGEGARVRVGLTQCGPDDSPLTALIAANNALLRLQRIAPGELIATAGSGDDYLLGANAAVADGIFSEGFSRPESRAYLAALAAIDADPHHAGDYLAAVLTLTLAQRGVAGVAIYRRRFDDSYQYAAGYVRAGDGAGPVEIPEKQLPRAMKNASRKADTAMLRSHDRIGGSETPAPLFPLRLYEKVLGFMVLHHAETSGPGQWHFAPDVAALHHLATELAALADWRQAGDIPPRAQPVAPRPLEEHIDGYVGDNMEGAIDQAVFLARLDVPVAVIGPRGTGKLYVAKVIHHESGLAADKLVSIDCREFRGRKDALNRIARELERSGGKTLVFKSPHLMHAEVQLKLARQLSSRILADTSPPRYLPAARIIALFPDSLEHLVRHGGLNERLASIFAAYPIRVPPIKDRKRAVLRWAHKILAQEASRRDRKVTGFTPDAEQALLQHNWPGNISEMRQCVATALDKTDKEWLTPVDLGLFKGLSPSGPDKPASKRAFLQALVDEPPEEAAYTPTTLEELGVALGEAVHAMLELESIKPLGAWLDDEVVLAACERYRENLRAAADFLQTKPRNISRWMPKVLSRDHERSSSSLWQAPQRLVRQWIREAAPMSEPPQQVVQAILLSHVVGQCGELGVADRARIMGVSTPTYQKRLHELLDQ